MQYEAIADTFCQIEILNYRQGAIAGLLLYIQIIGCWHTMDRPSEASSVLHLNRPNHATLSWALEHVIWQFGNVATHE